MAGQTPFPAICAGHRIGHYRPLDSAVNHRAANEPTLSVQVATMAGDIEIIMARLERGDDRFSELRERLDEVMDALTR